MTLMGPVVSSTPPMVIVSALTPGALVLLPPPPPPLVLPQALKRSRNRSTLGRSRPTPEPPRLRCSIGAGGR